MKPIQFEIPRHTLILTCGPTMCGKTKLIYDQFLSSEFSGYKTAYLGSDQIRMELLEDGSHHRHSPAMLSVSEQAFSILMASLRAHVSYPVSTDYVIIDVRGFDEAHRKQLLAIAQENEYQTMIITFEYKTREEYTIGCKTDDERRVVEMDLKRYRQKVLPTITTRDWNMRVRIKSPTQEVKFFPKNDNLPYGVQGTLCYEPGGAVAVIGDSHECVDELLSLVSKIEEKHGKEMPFVHLSDYLDKGGDTFRMLDAMHSLFQTGRHFMVSCNHGQYVYRRLKGELPPNPELETTYFSSLQVLEAQTEEAEKYRQIFFELYEHSFPFLRLVSENAREIIATHAPCETKYLGKLSADARRAQRNFYQKDRTVPVKQQLGFIYQQANHNHPLHVFGHVSHRSDNLVYKNKVFLDTGAVNGGKLTALVMKDNRYEFMHVDCKQRFSSGVDSLPNDLTFVEKEVRKFNIHDYDLTAQDLRLVRNVMSNNVKYISGTMPPAPSTDKGLETLEAAFEYYRRKDVKEVVLQPKYMGSRCQMYLFRDPEKTSFCVSRSGWVIRHVEGLDDLLSDWRQKVFPEDEDLLQSVVLDGELLPWKALGAGLIDNQFVPYGELVGYELSTLHDDFAFRKFKLGEDYNPGQRLLELSEYSAALSLYAGDAPLEFKPFDILLVNEEAYQGSAWTGFATFNDDRQLLVDLNNAYDIQSAMAFYDFLTVDEGMEGVVVKPVNRVVGVVPYMKVRNSEYLRLVYGYDYPYREEQLIRQKNISGKVAVAVREHALAMQMLTADDDKRKELAVKLIAEMKKEAEFDPRL